jgi:CheY-like chemotaxis protein
LLHFLHLTHTDIEKKSNAIKFTRAGCCARVCLEFSSDMVKLIVSDCGYGMSEDFVRHNIYLPFAQQDPVASGMGLGLSLVKRNVDRLGGKVDIETDQASGTTASISVPTSDLFADTQATSNANSQSQIPPGIIPSIPKQPKENLPVMHACFYAPSTWLQRHDQRDKRSINLVFDSLSSTLSEWYQPVLSLWQHQKKRTLPDLVFISQRNLAEFQQECGEEFTNVKKVVICAAIGKNSAQDRERIRQASTVADALITGAVLPSKLWEVVTNYFPHILQPGSSAEAQKSDNRQDKSANNGVPEEAGDDRREGHEGPSYVSRPEPASPSEKLSNDDDQEPEDHAESFVQTAAAESGSEKDTEIEAVLTIEPGDEDAANKLLRTVSNPALTTRKAIMKRNLTVPILQGSAQPHLLLVDDNSVNLKMLGMFVSKCGIPAAHSTSVVGGREAIEAYKSFESKNSTALGFDIILMDLSMPEVSGFEATSTIREIEKASDVDHKAYIVALTGLVSDKDRSAAHEAGVDDYVTKPAGLQKVRAIVDAWQKRKYDFAG